MKWQIYLQEVDVASHIGIILVFRKVVDSPEVKVKGNSE
jgi:hypothetical protein